MTKTHQEFMQQFEDVRKPLVEAMLASIIEVCPTLTESIKWNAPNFSDDGNDRMTLMLHKKELVSLILHTGARPKEDKKAPHMFTDESGLLEWNSNIRATVSFADLDEFWAKKSLFQAAVTRWVEETKGL
ncbi:MAG: hypothetical protein CVU42_04250 [Chloroflexi bacterium HGW-Chloroflexi-4]|nr:MAG: hypothetical protein CVU42_04250 [Chloroflexi bacterium HGW-Chloroflexi-4]